MGLEVGVGKAIGDSLAAGVVAVSVELRIGVEVGAGEPHPASSTFQNIIRTIVFLLKDGDDVIELLFIKTIIAYKPQPEAQSGSNSKPWAGYKVQEGVKVDLTELPVRVRIGILLDRRKICGLRRLLAIFR